MTQADHKMSLQAALENVAVELDIIARKSFEIDEAMGKAIDGAGTVDEIPLEVTQNVDLVRQSADCMHIVMNNISALTGDTSELPEQVEKEDVIRGVYLGSIRDRMLSKRVVEERRLQDQEGWIDL